MDGTKDILLETAIIDAFNERTQIICSLYGFSPLYTMEPYLHISQKNFIDHMLRNSIRNCEQK